MQWLIELGSHPVLGDAVYLVAALAALVLRQLAHRSRLGRDLDASFSLIALGLVVGAASIAVEVAGFTRAAPYLDAVFVCAVAVGAVRAVITFFVDFYLRQREGAAVSAIFRDVASIVAYFLVVVFVLRLTLDINLASLVATSAVLTVIVGLALQDVLGNLFSGLALEMEAHYDPGDWVRVGNFEGRVQETGWRTTRIVTRNNESVSLPNAIISKEGVINYSRPSPLFRDQLELDAAYEIPPNVVKEAIVEVLAADPDVCRTPEAEVRLQEYRDSGIHYDVRYWITDFGARERIRNRLMTALWYAMRRSNVRFPFPARDVFVYTGESAPAAAEAADPVTILRGVHLLEPLSDAEIERLARRVRRLTFGTGETVVRQGDSGDSFYVIERGAAEITLMENGASRRLGHLEAGDFFGEMSLLAGDPRNATVRASGDLVVLEVDRGAFKETLSANPAILEPLSTVAAHRQEARQQSLRELQSARAAVDPQQVRRLRERIKDFFRL